MPQAPTDNYIIRMDKAFQDEITTPGGLKLYMDTYYSPEWNTTVTGNIVSVPRRLTSRPDLRGRTIEGCAGEEMIFSYMVVYDMESRDNDTPIHNNLFYHGGEYFWKVDAFQVLGFIRNGELCPAQGYVFLEAMQPETPPKSGLIWLPESTVKEAPKGRGRVIGVGANKSTDPKLSIAAGDVVRYAEKFACRYTVKGREIIILDQAKVLAKES